MRQRDRGGRDENKRDNEQAFHACMMTLTACVPAGDHWRSPQPTRLRTLAGFSPRFGRPLPALFGFSRTPFS
jgi:hypothetical protein